MNNFRHVSPRTDLFNSIITDDNHVIIGDFPKSKLSSYISENITWEMFINKHKNILILHTSKKSGYLLNLYYEQLRYFGIDVDSGVNQTENKVPYLRLDYYDSSIVWFCDYENINITTINFEYYDYIIIDEDYENMNLYNSLEDMLKSKAKTIFCTYDYTNGIFYNLDGINKFVFKNKSFLNNIFKKDYVETDGETTRVLLGEFKNKI